MSVSVGEGSFPPSWLQIPVHGIVIPLARQRASRIMLVEEGNLKRFPETLSWEQKICRPV